MNGAHLHLVLNHFPVIGLVFAVGLLAVAQFRRNPELARVAAASLVVVAAVSIIVYMTGEPAEEIVEELPGMSHDLIEAHEEAALIALFLLEGLGVLALAGLFFFRDPKPLPKWFVPGLLAMSLIAVAWVGWTSHLGGHISHPESRADFEIEAESEGP
jgi:uncharacterized membrane protein